MSGPGRRLSVLIAALGGCVFVAAACTARPAPETAAESVQLQPVSDAGANPFAPPVGADVANVAVPAKAGGTVSGSTAGLYGGTLSQSSCDPTKMTSFLQQHPDKATAWASVLGITASDITKFVAELTPAVLRSDTYVINHGFTNGQATTVPSVLQAGTAVLVDAFGFPVTRCFCGNPLTKPTAFSRVKYVGPAWSSFSVNSVTVVQSTTVVVNNFTLVEPHTGASFDRPRGTDGRQDSHARPGAVPSSTVDPHTGPGKPSPTTAAPTTAAAPTTSAPATPASTPTPSVSPSAGPALRAPGPTTPAPSTSESGSSAADRSIASSAVGDCYGTKSGVHATVLVRNASRSTTHSYQATVAWGGDPPYATQTAALSGVAPGATGRTEVTADGSAPFGPVPCAITTLVDETGAVPDRGPDLAPPPDTQPQPTTDAPTTPAPVTEPPATQGPVAPVPPVQPTTEPQPSLATPDEPTIEPTTEAPKKLKPTTPDPEPS